MLSQMQTAEYKSHPIWLGCCHTYVFIGMLIEFCYAQEYRAGLPWLYKGAALRVYVVLCHQPGDVGLYFSYHLVFTKLYSSVCVGSCHSLRPSSVMRCGALGSSIRRFTPSAIEALMTGGCLAILEADRT